MDTPKDISVLFRKMKAHIDTLLIPLGISNSQASFLFCLHDNEEMSQIEMCRELDLDKSTVAKMLVRLEKDGYIFKRVNPENSHSFLVALTEKSNKIVPVARKIQAEWLEKATYNLTDIEKDNFFRLINRVADNAAELTIQCR